MDRICVQARSLYVRRVPDLHDMGGRREFFGPIVREADEPVFHSRWEARVFGMSPFVQAVVGRNIDAARYAMERLPRDEYLAGYYRRWLGGFETQLLESGYLAPGELDARVEGRRVGGARRRVSRARLALTAAAVRSGLRPRLPAWIAGRVLPRLIGNERPALSRPRFAVGTRVRVRHERADGHTRQPGYVSGRPGLITAHHGATLLPDAHAVGRRMRPQHLYTVAFAGTDLWGEDAEPDTEVRVDLYEPYLEPA